MKIPFLLSKKSDKKLFEEMRGAGMKITRSRDKC
jgi:hypothetical protein